MSGTTALSGWLGKVLVSSELVARLTMWRINESVSESVWGDSDSAGFTNRKDNRRDCTGSIGGKFDTDQPPYTVVKAGDIVTLALWQSTEEGDYWAFPSALIQSFEMEFNPDTMEVVGWTSNFGADGEFFDPANEDRPEYSLPTQQ